MTLIKFCSRSLQFYVTWLHSASDWAVAFCRRECSKTEGKLAHPCQIPGQLQLLEGRQLLLRILNSLTVKTLSGFLSNDAVLDRLFILDFIHSSFVTEHTAIKTVNNYQWNCSLYCCLKFSYCSVCLKLNCFRTTSWVSLLELKWQFWIKQKREYNPTDLTYGQNQGIWWHAMQKGWWNNVHYFKTQRRKTRQLSQNVTVSAYLKKSLMHTQKWQQEIQQVVNI